MKAYSKNHQYHLDSLGRYSTQSEKTNGFAHDKLLTQGRGHVKLELNDGGKTMTPPGNKSLLPLYLLEIFHKYTDSDHHLTQQELIQRIKSDYDVEVERKAVARNITLLQAQDYDIIKDQGYYLAERTFDDSELRLLIDSLLFSRHIPIKQCKELIKKLEEQSTIYFKSRTQYVQTVPEKLLLDNKQLFHTIDILDEAINKEKKVTFTYNAYGTDKKLHPKRQEKYIVNPYQMVAANGRYYLISNTDKYGDVSHYRIDHITDIEILDQQVKPIRDVKGLENGFNLPKHMAEHIYMFSGESVRVHCIAKKSIVNEIIDWFGEDVEFYDETDSEVKFTIFVNEKALYYWMKQYGEYLTETTEGIL